MKGEGPSGPSLTRMIFADYFLTVSRHLAGQLSAEAEAGAMPTPAQGSTPPESDPLPAHGLRLPDPATTPPVPPIDLEKLDVESGYSSTASSSRSTRRKRSAKRR